jgi:hypothetical protein
VENRVAAQRPCGVTVLGRLSIFFGIPIGLAGMALFFGGLFANAEKTWGFNFFFAVAGLVLVVTSLPYCIVGIGLLKLRNWSRLLAIAFSGLSILGVLSIVITRLGHIGMALGVYLVIRAGIDIWILLYMSRPEVKLAFASASG